MTTVPIQSTTAAPAMNAAPRGLMPLRHGIRREAALSTTREYSKPNRTPRARRPPSPERMPKRFRPL